MVVSTDSQPDLFNFRDFRPSKSITSSMAQEKDQKKEEKHLKKLAKSLNKSVDALTPEEIKADKKARKEAKRAEVKETPAPVEKKSEKATEKKDKKSKRKADDAEKSEAPVKKTKPSISASSSPDVAAWLKEHDIAVDDPRGQSWTPFFDFKATGLSDAVLDVTKSFDKPTPIQRCVPVLPLYLF